jgi:general secretion pathway protein D
LRTVSLHKKQRASILMKRLWNIVITLTISLSICTFQAQAEETITLDFEDVEIRNLIRFMAEATGRNFIVDNKVVGKVTIISPRPLPISEALSTFENLLAASGYAIVPAGNVLRISSLAEAGKSPVDVISGENNKRPGEVVTQLIRLKHISANTIIPVLNPLLSRDATLSAYLPANTLVLTENYANVKRVNALIEKLDTDVDQNSRSIAIVYLKNAESKSLAEVLNTMIKNAGKDGASSEENTLAAFRSHVAVVADESTNSLIVSAEPSDMTVLKDTIKRLDIRRLQVYIEALIMEVSADIADQFGVEWRSAANLSTSTGITPFGGQTFGNSISALSDNPLALPTGFAFGLAGGNITFRGQEYANIGFLLRALKSDSNVNILSTPQLLTLDNEEAEIVVGDNVPFITGTYNNENSNPFQTIERQDVGLTLRIRPQISENGFVRLNIYQEISSISNQSTEASDIITRKRSIKTTVIVPDQKMIALGGLIRDDITHNVSQVPCLANLFGAGELFRNTSVANSKTNLMIFIKPHIINAYGDMDSITKEKYLQMRELQLTDPLPGSRFVDVPVHGESDIVPKEMRHPAPKKESEKADDSDKQSSLEPFRFAASPPARIVLAQ